MKAIFALSDEITGQALLVNDSWPFVTTSHFEVKGAHARADLRTEIVIFVPLFSAMFPSNVRDRIMAEAAKNSKPERGLSHFEGSKRKLKSFLADEPDIDKDDSVFQSKPIADLFPAVTISR